MRRPRRYRRHRPTAVRLRHAWHTSSRSGRGVRLPATHRTTTTVANNSITPPSTSAARTPANAIVVPSTATPTVIPTTLARFTTPEANPARVSGIADIARPTAGPVLNANPAPVKTNPTSRIHAFANGPAAA